MYTVTASWPMFTNCSRIDLAILYLDDPFATASNLSGTATSFQFSGPSGNPAHYKVLVTPTVLPLFASISVGGGPPPPPPPGGG